MRVTRQALINSFLQNLRNTSANLQTINTQISSGKRVQRPEDDSVAAAAIVRLQSQINETKQYQENIMQSLSELNSIDTTLGDISGVLMRARELGVQASNDTMSPAERDAIAVEVNQLLESLVQTANTTMGGKFLFAGHNSDAVAFESVRGAEIGEVKDIVTIDGELRRDINTSNITQVRYLGNDGQNNIQIDQSLLTRNNITGQEIFFYDTNVNSDSAKLFEKQVGINETSQLSAIINALGKTSVSAGYLFVKNTNALQLSANTNPNGDNSTSLALLNNGRGIGVDEFGNTSLGAVQIKDSGGNIGTFNYTNIAALGTIQEMTDFLNQQTWHPITNPTGPQVSFTIAANAIQMTDHAKGGGIASVTDTGNSFMARDLGLLDDKKIDFPAIRFGNDTPLNAWLKEPLPNMAGSNISVQDAYSNNITINLASLNNTSTVGDFINLFNQQCSTVSVQLSTDGFGLEYIDQTEGSANIHIKNSPLANGFDFVSALTIGTPEMGAEKTYSTGNGALVDLTDVGDTILTVDDLLSSINRQVQHIGVKAGIDPASHTISFTEIKPYNQLGEFNVSVSNAIGLHTPLSVLNEGGGINGSKIQITDASGVSQIIDFQGAQTVLEVIDAINTYIEPITESTTLQEIEGLSLTTGLGSIEFSTTSGTVKVDLSSLTTTSTVQELMGKINEKLITINAKMSMNLEGSNSAIRFSFEDLVNADGQGIISIQDGGNGTTAQELGIIAYAEGTPYIGEFIAHKRVNVKANLNSDCTGIQLSSNDQLPFTVSEFENRTTASDLGLLTFPTTSGNRSVCVNGIIRGADLNVFYKIADEIGVSAKIGTTIKRSHDSLSAIQDYGGISDKLYGITSGPIYTTALSTLKGAADLDPQLHGKTKLSILNNAASNNAYNGNYLPNIDLSGALSIESLHDDGTGAFERIIIDFQHLPNNPTVNDLQELINGQIAADHSFHGKIDLKISEDGRIKFISDVPIRFNSSTIGRATGNDLFGNNLPTDFQHSISTKPLGLEQQNTGGVDINNFFISDPIGGGSLEIDLERISFEKYNFKRELELEDIKNYIEFNSHKPAQLSPNTLLLDLGVITPLNIPGTDPAFLTLNNLDISSTVQDFINCIATPGSVFAGNMRIEIANGINNSPEADRNKKLVLIDSSGLVNGSSLEYLKLPPELNQVLTTLGLKSGGQLSNLPGGTNVGIIGNQITGLGYGVSVDIDPIGQVNIKSQDPRQKGRLYIKEGRGTTAADLKILDGTGAIGNGTTSIISGNLNPGAERNSLLSELVPKTSGINTSFDALLRDIYIENGMDTAQIKLLQKAPISMQTPLKALNNGNVQLINGVYEGGIDVGRPASGFEIEDQFGNRAIVDLSNNLSQSSYYAYPTNPPYPTAANIDKYLYKPVGNVTAAAMGSDTRFTGIAGNFSEFQVGDFFEIGEDLNLDAIGQPQSILAKYQITAIAADGSWVEIADSSTFDPSAGNYTLNVFPRLENMYAKMESEYVNKPFYSPESTVSDLQKAIDIAIDKAKRATEFSDNPFGVDQIVLSTSQENNSLILSIVGDNSPTITIHERDVNGDGQIDSRTATDLRLLREFGARGSGSPVVESGQINVSPTLSYLIDTINNPLTGINVTASIGNNGSGPTIDISSNTNSSYMKIRDTFEGYSASQTGLTTTRSIFQTMIDFRDALYRNDADYISKEILKQISQDEERVLEYRAQIGSIVNRFESNVERLETTKIEQTSRFSEHQDLNLSDAIIELRQLELMQRAALNIGSRIFQQTLLDFLR